MLQHNASEKIFVFDLQTDMTQQKNCRRKKVLRFALQATQSRGNGAVLCCHCHANERPCFHSLSNIHLQFYIAQQPFNRYPRSSLTYLLLPFATASPSRFDASNECDRIHPGHCVSVLERIKCEIRDTTSRRIHPVYLFTHFFRIIFVSPV